MQKRLSGLSKDLMNSNNDKIFEKILRDLIKVNEIMEGEDKVVPLRPPAPAPAPEPAERKRKQEEERKKRNDEIIRRIRR